MSAVMAIKYKEGGVIIGLNECTQIKELQRIPGVGHKTAEDLFNLGFRSPDELKGQDPEEMYRRLCALQSVKVDRCILYVFRCAVYFASHPEPDPELLKWWNWKDRRQG